MPDLKKQLPAICRAQGVTLNFVLQLW